MNICSFCVLINQLYPQCRAESDRAEEIIRLHFKVEHGIDLSSSKDYDYRKQYERQ